MMKTELFKRSIFFVFLQIVALFSPLAWSQPTGKLAIVIDDIGYHPKEDAAIFALPKAVSVAIIPSAPYALERAQAAHQQQRDILIHLPMQPQNLNIPIEAGALKIGASFSEAEKLLQAARSQVPYAIGLNNHMGSGATADSETMRHFMQALSRQKLFFLDSKTGKSVAFKTAQQAGIPALERHIFLDDSNELADVEQQFQQAVLYARKHGVAIMIGHPRKNSVAVLQRRLANLPADIQLVSLGSLWRGEKVEPVEPFIVIFNVPAPTSVAPFDSISPLLRGIPKE